MSERERLANRHRQETLEFDHAGPTFSLSAGFCADGRIGELFISSRKVGTPIEALARGAAIVLSVAFQHGADLTAIRRALTQDKSCAPSSLIGAAVDALRGLPDIRSLPREDK